MKDNDLYVAGLKLCINYLSYCVGELDKVINKMIKDPNSKGDEVLKIIEGRMNIRKSIDTYKKELEKQEHEGHEI